MQIHLKEKTKNVPELRSFLKASLFVCLFLKVLLYVAQICLELTNAAQAALELRVIFLRDCLPLQSIQCKSLGRQPIEQFPEDSRNMLLSAEVKK